ncbi:XkdW family protein [Brevibacillus borstelensis]|uniref:XkdW family protein n=1 Tax=Brevibacillus borstelensis TaxID=45462 RepID=UPI00203D35D4|nr:XkdW family protein [Brevibacillus borstelensis]MCM3560575.1 XkdW family protein [Brevibacillus borstelensis]
MKFIKFEKENNTKALVTFIHYLPFDQVHGLPDEVLATGILVGIIPDPEPNGKIPKLYINPETQEMWYEYIDSPPEPIDAIGQEVARQKFDNLQKDMIIQTFGQEMTAMKLELMQLKAKGGE